MDFLILLGPPGAGKGTLSRQMQAHQDWIPVSTGEEIRKRMADPTDEIGRLSTPYMERGDYVPDELALRLFEDIVAGFPKEAKVVLDGFPRTVPQAEILTETLSACGDSLKTCVFLNLDPETAAARMQRRRVCPECRKTFPTVAGDPAGQTCDECGAVLIPREDDDPERMARRVLRYTEQTVPLRDWFRERGMLLELDASLSTEELRRKVLGDEPTDKVVL